MEEAHFFFEKTVEKLILDAEKSGTREVIYPSGYNYSGELPLSFFAPSKHTNYVLFNLRKLGYTVEIIEKEERNYEYEFYGDGEYHTVDTGGFHTNYQLRITW